MGVYWAVYDYGSRRLYGVYEASQTVKAQAFLRIVRDAAKHDKTKWTIDKQTQFKYWGRAFLIRDIECDKKPVVGTSIDEYQKAIVSESGF